MYIIRVRPYGRGGNRIFQTIHAIAFAKARAFRVIVEANPPFLPEIDLDFSSGTAKIEKSLNTFHLGTSEMEGFSMSLDERREIARQFISPRLLIAPIVSDATTLVMHLRSGDIMHPDTAHPKYTPLPLGFHETVICDERPSRTIVVTEPDRAHPCLQYLIDRFDPIVIDDLVEGFGWLLGAASVLACVSTFSGSAVLSSHQIRRLHCVERLNPFRLNRKTPKPSFCELHLYAVKQLVDIKWCASPSQKEMIATMGKSSCQKIVSAT